MIAITELDTVSGAHQDDWVLNVSVDNASGGVDIKTGVTDYRHGISSIVITANNDEEVEILNGEDILIGPLNLEKGFPWPKTFNSEIYCDRGNALKIKTESDFKVHLLIEGCTGKPVSSLSASPSASPSEGA